jgi:Lsr2
MAQKVTVSLQDDLDGGPAAETVRFALAGAQFEIDLSEQNARTFRQQINPFLEHARRAGRITKSRPASRGAASRERSSGIRAWARDHGMAVSERGRLPASIIERYEAATNGQ